MSWFYYAGFVECSAIASVGDRDQIRRTSSKTKNPEKQNGEALRAPTSRREPGKGQST